MVEQENGFLGKLCCLINTVGGEFCDVFSLNFVIGGKNGLRILSKCTLGRRQKQKPI